MHQCTCHKAKGWCTWLRLGRPRLEDALRFPRRRFLPDPVSTRAQACMIKATLTCRVALPFWMRILCPWPSILPSAETRQAPMGTPPSTLPWRASCTAALNPASSADMMRDVSDSKACSRRIASRIASRVHIAADCCASQISFWSSTPCRLVGMHGLGCSKIGSLEELHFTLFHVPRLLEEFLRKISDHGCYWWQLRFVSRPESRFQAALGCWVTVEGHRIGWNLLQLGAVDIPG